MEAEVVRVETPDVAARPRPSLPVLLVLFAASGCAALIYEMVWLQLLQLVVGSTAVSMAVLLSAYMGGLCAGSAAFPRIVSARHHPLRVYALLELGIGAFGILALIGVPVVSHFYAAAGGQGLVGLVLRGVVAALCLLPPTLLMGGVFPAVSRWVQTTPKGVSWLGLLYSANIAGAVIGCLGAGFYLLRLHNMAVATYAAAAINAAVALFGFGLATRRFDRPDAPPKENSAPSGRLVRAPGARFVYLAIALSGMTALGAEVVWTRLLSLL